jgi:hypothetical protein
MTIRNRELSQFGSFIYIDDSTRTVGIATTATPYVGIGTTNAQYKLDVVGDTNIAGKVNITNDINIGGILTASSYYLNGSPLVDATTLVWLDATGNDIYRPAGNVGIGTSIIGEKLTVIGNVSAGQFISTVTTGTAPLSVSSQTLVTNLNSDYLRGKTPPSGDIVGTSDSQTLSNKTLTSPTISSINNGGTLTLPTTSGTLVSTGSVGVVTAGMIADLTITNSDVSSSAAIDYSKLNLSNSIVNADIASGASIAISKLAASTISGVSLGSTLNNLTAGSFVTYNSGSTYNGSSAITIGVAGTTANTANTLIARNSSGDFSAGAISCSSVNSSFDINTNTTIKINNNVVIDAGRNINCGVLTATSINASTGILTATAIYDSGGNLRAIPNNAKSSSYILAIGDVGELINITTGGVTVPSGVFSAGDNVTIYNNSASPQSITQGSGVTLRLVGTASTGSRTLDQRGLATVLCVASNEFVISGGGLA